MRHLKYWWIPNAQIDPQNVTEDYFRVFYDKWGREVIIERFSPDHQLKERTKFIWRRTELERTENYHTDGTVKNYSLRRYNWYGGLLKIEEYSPDGQLTRVFDNPAE